jgi:glycosyltransferase involved in cell wall biosynthesis
VIARSVAELAAEVRPVRVVSLTRPEFLGDAPGAIAGAVHVEARAAGAAGEFRALPAILRTARRVLREQPSAVAHLIGLPYAVAPVLRRSGVRVVVHATLGGHVYQGRVDRLRDAAGRLFDPWIDAYACASETVRASLAAAGHAQRRLQLFGPPTDERVFAPRDRGEARRTLGLPPDAFLVVYIGTVSPMRFPAPAIGEALVRAAARIGEQPGTVLLEAFAPVGTHGYNVAWARDNVGAAAAATGAPLGVRLQDLDDEGKALAYSAADVVLLPFAAPVAVEPPLTLLEALSCGAAVLAAPDANRSGIVEHGRTGLTYDGPEQLAARLCELHALGPEWRAALGAAGRAEVVGRFGRAAALTALEDVWRAAGAG